MKTQHPVSLAPLMLLAAVTGCDGPMADPEAALQPVALRSGSPTLTGTPKDGYICLDLAYPCDAPEQVTLARDGIDHWAWSAQTEHADSPVGEAPEHVCLFTDDVPAGAHQYLVRATCDGIESSTRPQTFLTTQPSITLDEILADRAYYSAGDTITLEVSTGGAAMGVSADFSAIDDGYVPGSETVAALGGGRLAITYALSTANTTAAGDHEVVVSALDATGGPARTHRIPLRYLPSGPMRSHVAGGAHRPDARQPRIEDGSIVLDAVVDTGVDVEADAAADEHPDFGPGIPPTDPASGRVLELSFRTAGPTPPVGLAVEVWEPDRDGHTRVPLDASSATCNAVECSYTDTIVVAPKLPDATGPSITLGLAVVAGGKGSVAGTTILSPFPPTPPSWFTVHGTITYPARDMAIDCPNFPNTDMTCPQSMVNVVRPVRRMSVKIYDECGGVTQAWTDDEGELHKTFSTFCPGDPVRIRVSSHHQPAPLPIAVFRRVVPPPVHADLAALLDDLTNDPSDYTVPSEVVSTFVPSVDAPSPGGYVFAAQIADSNLATSIHVAEVTRRALDYYQGWADLGSQVSMNMLWDAAEEVTDGNYNVYVPDIHPGMIHIMPSSGWSDFAIAHETGHALHWIFVRDHGPLEPDPPYGRFGEAMSNAHAAAITGSAFISYTSGLAEAESMDYNGKYDENVGAKQAVMDFHADVYDAAASLSCGGVDPDPCCAEATPQARGNCVLAHSMGWDWRIYYDLLDDESLFQEEPVESFFPAGGGAPIVATDFDQFDGDLGPSWGGHAIMDVVTQYLGRGPNANPAYVDRGQEMVDLVDVLDGLSCRGHIVQADVEALLEDAMGYDYDFGYVGASCP